MRTSVLDHLLEEVRRVPGLTVDKMVLRNVDWNHVVDPPLEKWMAEQTDRDLEHDKYGNPVFMPKDEAQKQEIRDTWKRIDEAMV